jgi:hypothetical protein
MQADCSQPRSWQFGEEAEREVTVLLARCGELPFGGIEVAQESVVSLDRGVQVGQGRRGTSSLLDNVESAVANSVRIVSHHLPRRSVTP